METLPRPTTLDCEDCGDPVEIVYSSWPEGADTEDLNEAVRLIRCPKHQAPYWLGAQEWLDRHRMMRWEIGNPPGTLFVFKDQIGDQNALHSSDGTIRRFPSLIYAIDIDWWDESWPQVVIPAGITKAGLVILGAVVALVQLPGPCWVFRWSWQHPARQASCELVGWDAPMKVTEARILMDALGAFREYRGPGRPRGTSRSESVKEFEAAVFRTVCKLVKSNQEPSYKNIGRIIGNQSRPAGREPLRDPARSFTRLCESRQLNARELVDRAIEACATGE